MWNIQEHPVSANSSLHSTDFVCSSGRSSKIQSVYRWFTSYVLLTVSAYPSTRLFSIKYQGETTHWYYGQMINDWLAMAEEEGGARETKQCLSIRQSCGWEKCSTEKYEGIC
jgi:hypothetical protein